MPRKKTTPAAKNRPDPPPPTSRWAPKPQSLLTPAEIAAIREKKGLSRAEFARITKLGVASLTLWESGKREPNVANDYYLRLLALDENFDRVFSDFGRSPSTGAPASAKTELASRDAAPLVDASAVILQAADAARRAIEQRIAAMPLEKLGTLMAAILRCMGLHPWPADPTARQHGIALIGYSDPLGTSAAPRVVVSILADGPEPDAATSLRKLAKQLREGEMALAVLLTGFSPDAIQAVRESRRRIELIDVRRLAELWVQYYDKASAADRGTLPLRTFTIVSPE